MVCKTTYPHKQNSCTRHYGFMASRSTKYTSLLSRCLLPDNSQRVIHNQSPRWFEAPLKWVQKIFLTVQKTVDNRKSTRIDSSVAYQLPCMYGSDTARCSHKNACRNMFQDREQYRTNYLSHGHTRCGHWADFERLRYEWVRY